MFIAGIKQLRLVLPKLNRSVADDWTRVGELSETRTRLGELRVTAW